MVIMKGKLYPVLFSFRVSVCLTAVNLALSFRIPLIFAIEIPPMSLLQKGIYLFPSGKASIKTEFFEVVRQYLNVDWFLTANLRKSSRIFGRFSAFLASIGEN